MAEIKVVKVILEGTMSIITAEIFHVLKGRSVWIQLVISSASALVNQDLISPQSMFLCWGNQCTDL